MLDGLTLDQMRTFVAVTDSGSFRAAATRLGRVQSAVSHAIANLEAQLGVELFDRAAYRPVPSPAGAALLADVRALLLRVDALRARASGLGRGVELEVRLGIDPQFPLPVLGAALAALCAAYPTVAFRLLSTPLGASRDALLDDTCDLAIAGIDLIHPAIEVEALTTVRRAAVAAHGHALAALVDRPLTATILADHVQVVVEDCSPSTCAHDFGVVSPLRWRVADNATKRALIVAGVGWGSLPLWIVEGDLDAGRLLRLPVAAFGPAGETSVGICLAHRADRPLGPAAAALRDRLLQVFRADGARDDGGTDV